MTAVSAVAERILQSLVTMDPQEIDLEAIVVFTTIGRSMTWSRHGVTAMTEHHAQLIRQRHTAWAGLFAPK